MLPNESVTINESGLPEDNYEDFEAGVDFFEDGVAISANDLDECAKSQNVDIKQGDFVIVRTGQMEKRLLVISRKD